MRIISMRFFLSSLCIGTLCAMVFGCSSGKQVDSQEPSLDTNHDTNNYVFTSTVEEDLAVQFNRVSLISQKGIEVELDAILFQEQWDEYINYLQEQDPFTLHDTYTIVGWDRQNQPYVIQVSAEGIKVGQDYYKGEQTENLVQWMQEHIGIEYLNNLSMESMIVEARDLEIKKELSPNSAEQVFQLIKSSTLVKGEARITTPLYPYYRIDVEYKKDQFLQLTILSPTLISIEDGNDRWYYQLNDSIFSFLKDAIPITYFSRQHIRHLFQANEIVYQHDDGMPVSLSDQIEEALILEASIHKMARLFAQGKRKEELSKPDTNPVYIVQFYMPDLSVSTIEVYDHFYFYRDQLFDLYDAGKKLENIIQVVQKHNRQ